MIAPQLFPAMVESDGSGFSGLAIGLSLLAGALYAIGTAPIFHRYLKTAGAQDFFLVNIGALSAIAGFAFARGEGWGDIWWYWHILRLIALTSAFGYAFYSWQRSNRITRETALELQARTKEISCLHAVTDIVRREESLRDMFERAVDVIPPGWQHPEIARARILWGGMEFVSDDFKRTPWMISEEIASDGKIRGRVEVYYTECPTNDLSAAFLPEEQALLGRIAGILGSTISAKQNQQDLTNIFNNATDMICIADLKSNTFTKVNPAFTAVLGFAEEELLEKDFLSFTHADDVEPTAKVVEEQLKAGETVLNFQNRYRCKDGSYKWLSWVSHPDPDQGVTFAIARDITEQKESADKLAAAVKELERSNQELEQFAYVASHDLQEPLRVVSSYTQLLERRYKDQFDEKGTKFMNYIVDGASRMQKLISDLLKYSRINTRGEELKSIESADALGSAIVALGSLIQETQAVVTNDNLPEVKADEGQLAQVFQNLIGNAIKFRREDVTPHVHIGVKKDGRQWLFSVADNGIGFEDKFKNRIFEIFQRLHGREHYDGTGIGLAICKRVVERHGGKIWAESTPGEGTTFYFTLKQLKQKEQ